ncbi:MAG: TlyA family RNA methyltransferase [Rhodospirillales bacterium]|nr:TlyA family RNA methyltransferase [Rhodospirillales bacterium]
MSGEKTAKPGPKRRLDQLLVDRGIVESRARAQALIMAGLVYSGETRLDKAGKQVASDIQIDMRGQDHPWVSRGGLKLDHALKHFGISAEGAVCLDIGASTGGFTDVLLAAGAAKIYAVDVGSGQLAWKLRQDERVQVLEKVNARYLSDEDIPEQVAFICCDASFIGLTTILPTPLGFAARGAHLVALIKPQFEVGRKQVGKGGIVSDSKLHDQVCDQIESWINNLKGWTVIGITESPITGAEGNKEFLIAARKG